ncbi:MAG TPA: carbon-nitrogen hydrolase [Bacteroidetes bacterium]|nr:carbon-nitrogen hydrolase [Bacteroidota bacterium]
MKKIFLFIALFVAAYLFWSYMGRKGKVQYKFNEVKYFPVFQKDPATANIVGVQPYMTNLDYQDENSFYKKLDYYMAQAKNKNWLRQNTTVVFPEHIASWLVAAGEKKSVYTADNIDAAMQIMVLSNLLNFLNYYFKSNADDPATDAVFQMKAKKMAQIYQSVFSRLARKYKTNIVAGSIFLPNPKIMDNKLIAGKGPIYNMSAVFLPDGKIAPALVKKKYPIGTELPFCAKNENALPVYQLNSGKIGVAICADAWYGDIYSELNKNKASIFIAPSYSTGHKIWPAKWHGYDGATAPAEINKKDIENITLGRAWHKYTIKRIGNTNIKTGIVVFLRGEIWDLGTDGHSFIYRNGNVISVPKTDMPLLFNVEI